MEEWRPIDNKYDVSNTGKVRNSKTGRVLAYQHDRSGFRTVKMYDGEKYKGARVARLVAVAFGNEDITGKIIHYKNNDIYDERIENLEALTRIDHANKMRRLNFRKDIDKYVQ